MKQTNQTNQTMNSIQFCREIQDCMFTPEYIEQWCKLEPRVTKVIPVKKVIEPTVDKSVFQVIPAKQFRGVSKPSDTLFWCLLYLYDAGLYDKEIAFASYRREQELKYKMIESIQQVAKTVNEKEIQTYGYGNKRICKSKGLEPLLSIKGVIAELAGSKPMSLEGVSAFLAYHRISTPCYAVLKYDTMTLAVPVGMTMTSDIVQFQVKHPRMMILTRERFSWCLTEQQELDAVILSSLTTCLRPISVYTSQDLEAWCDRMNIPKGKTKKDKYEAIQQWIHYRICVLRNGFILYSLEK